MKKLFFLALACFSCLAAAYAQTDSATSIDEMPQFPGGIEKMNQFIVKTMQYPEFANINGIEGKAQVKFVVDTDGSVTEIELKKKVYPLLDDETMRIMKAMPKWKPGVKDGKPVKVFFTLPIAFRTAYRDDPEGLNAKGGYFTGRRAELFDVFPSYRGDIENALRVEDDALPRGTVNVLATINEDGLIVATEILGKAKQALEEPALKKVKSLNPKNGEQGWKPAMKDGQPVVCQMILPVRFNKN